MQNKEQLKFLILDHLGKIYNDLQDDTSLASFYDMTIQICSNALLQSTLHTATLKHMTMEDVKKEWENYTYNLFIAGLHTLQGLFSSKELN